MFGMAMSVWIFFGPVEWLDGVTRAWDRSDILKSIVFGLDMIDANLNPRWIHKVVTSFRKVPSA